MASSISVNHHVKVIRSIKQTFPFWLLWSVPLVLWSVMPNWPVAKWLDLNTDLSLISLCLYNYLSYICIQNTYEVTVTNLINICFHLMSFWKHIYPKIFIILILEYDIILCKNKSLCFISVMIFLEGQNNIIILRFAGLN